MSTMHPSNELFFRLMDSMQDMALKKQKDYGTDADPFANVRQGALDMGLRPWMGAALRMNDKMRRINKAARLGIDSLNFDSLEDDFMDMGNYSLIALTLLTEEMR